jgi:Fe-Mn family superoxide dismutase
MHDPNKHPDTDAPPVALSRRAALQGVVTAGGWLFLTGAGCGSPKPSPQAPSAAAPVAPPPEETAMPTEYTLPPLPYAIEALEPHLDAQTLKLHHDMHHKGYVDGANAAAKALEEARGSGDFKLVDHHSRKLSFHLSGHLLHSLFWTNMAPAGKGGAPSKELNASIQSFFGDLDKMKAQMSAAAKTVEGSGWGILAYLPMDQSLALLQVENHEKKTVMSAVPLLVVDVWEHAYYLKYQNRRADFITAWWNVVNWDDVSKRFARARQLKL